HDIISFVFPHFLNVTPPSALYPLSLHDALPIYRRVRGRLRARPPLRPRAWLRRLRRPHRAAVGGSERARVGAAGGGGRGVGHARSEEHTSELQSRGHLVCRLLLEKKKRTQR